MQLLLSLQVKVSYIMKDTADDWQTTIWCVIHKDGSFLWKQFKCKFFVSVEVLSFSACICAVRCFIKLKKTLTKSAVQRRTVMVFYVQVLKHIQLQPS